MRRLTRSSDQSWPRMWPPSTRTPSVRVGMRVSPAGRRDSHDCSAARSRVGASSSSRTAVRSRPRARSVDQGTEMKTRSAVSTGVAAPGSRAVTPRTISCGVPRSRYSPMPVAVICRPSASPAMPSSAGASRCGCSSQCSRPAPASSRIARDSSASLRRRLTRPAFPAAVRRRRLRRRRPADPRNVRRCRRTGSGCRIRVRARTPRRPWRCRPAWSPPAR